MSWFLLTKSTLMPMDIKQAANVTGSRFRFHQLRQPMTSIAEVKQNLYIYTPQKLTYGRDGQNSQANKEPLAYEEETHYEHANQCDQAILKKRVSCLKHVLAYVIGKSLQAQHLIHEHSIDFPNAYFQVFIAVGYLTQI
jgi:hypothetical protein